MGTAGAGADGVTGERRRLINVAYRLLGSVAEAEDAVQEAYARWFALPPGRRREIRVPGAWLTTVTGRICLDLLGSARARRERYVGAWLPEPLPDRTEWERAGGTPVSYTHLDVYKRQPSSPPTPPTRSSWTSRCRWPSWSCWTR